MMEEPEGVTRIEKLNPLGRAVWLGETAVRLTAGLLDKAVHRAARITSDSIRAFEEGRNPNIEDAKILEERYGRK